MVWTWLTSRSRGNEEHLRKTDKKLSDFEKRITKIESELSYLPTLHGQQEMALSISDLRGDMKQMTEALKSIKSTSARMENYLMHRSDR